MVNISYILCTRFLSSIVLTGITYINHVTPGSKLQMSDTWWQEDLMFDSIYHATYRDIK